VTPLRLVIVTARFWPQTGSAESTLARLAVGLAQRGCQVTIVTVRGHERWPAEIQFNGMPVVRIGPAPLGWWNRRRYERALGQWLRTHEADFDLVLVSGLRREAHVAMLAVGRRKPVVLCPIRSGLEGDCLWQINTPGGRKIYDQCIRARAMIATTPAIRRELEAAGYPGDRIYELRLGVAPQPIRTPESCSAARALLAEANAMLQLSDRAQLVVSTCRLAPGRGWDRLLAAWATVSDRRPSARLWLAGEAADRGAVGRKIESLGLVGRALAIGTFDDVEGLLAAAEIFVAPSPDGSPLAVLEAMAAELPVVAVDVPAHQWLITDHRDGLLVPPTDASALASAILSLLEQRDLAARLAAAARARVLQEFSLARMVDEHFEVIREVRNPVPSPSGR
jgi:glycosyltransferase involved in cell wall biosynthesis